MKQKTYKVDPDRPEIMLAILRFLKSESRDSGLSKENQEAISNRATWFYLTPAGTWGGFNSESTKEHEYCNLVDEPFKTITIEGKDLQISYESFEELSKFFLRND